MAVEAPPTAPVALAALLADRELGLRRLAGPAEAEVHGVHASEMPDPSPYLLGGELLLTAGSGLTGRAGAQSRGPGPTDSDAASDSAWDSDAASASDSDAASSSASASASDSAARAYVARLVRAGAAGLGFGVTPVHETVPPGLAQACAEYGLPLVEVPPGTPFTAVARAVWRLMAEARTRELRRVTEAQQSLASAAARPDPVPAVLSRLATALGGWAALWGPEGGPGPASAGATGPGDGPGSAGRPPTAGAPGGRPSPAGSGTVGGPAATGLAAAGPAGAVGPEPARPGTGTGTGAGAGAAGGASAPGFRPAGATAGVRPREEVRVALAALALRVAPGSAATATDALGGTHLAAYAVGGGQVLALATPGRAPGDHTIASVAAVLLTLLTASRPAGAEAAALTRLLLDGDPSAALPPGPWYAVRARGGGDPHALAAALGTVLLDPRGDGVRLLTDREPAPQPGWRLGVSAPAGPAELRTADAQARRALARAEASRTPLARHADPGVTGLVGEAEARAHAEALLAPLSPALRETLRAWLSHHGSWDRTAAALGVHRNTVRQRITRCAALLDDADLDDADTRMELWFALRWCGPAPDGTSGPPA